MNAEQAERFDRLLEEVFAALPESVRAIVDEVAVIVLDRPTPDMLEELEMDPEESDDLCGLHTGMMATERSVEDAWSMPSQIHLFRAGIIAAGGGFGDAGSGERVREQIRITLLHEIGHEFGLDEDQLGDLGYD
jgi:predicted Zn-dependent protease with MMP-like domain